MLLMRSLIAALVLLLLGSAEIDGSCEVQGTCNVEAEENVCTIYIAPSSLENVNGFGIFTTKAFKKGDMILPADAPSIIVFDPVFNFMPEDSARLDTYWWGAVNGASADAGFEDYDITDFGTTFDGLPNYHTYLSNLDSRIPHTSYDDTLVNGSDPGAGAFSYHMGRDFYAYNNVEAGEELFLDYGYPDYYEEYGQFKWFKSMPRHKDYVAGGEIMKNAWKLVESVRGKMDDTNKENEILGKIDI